MAIAWLATATLLASCSWPGADAESARRTPPKSSEQAGQRKGVVKPLSEMGPDRRCSAIRWRGWQTTEFKEEVCVCWDEAEGRMQEAASGCE